MNRKNNGYSSVKTSVIFIVILFLGFGGYLFLNNKAKAPTESTTSSSQDQNTTETKPVENTTTNPDKTIQNNNTASPEYSPGTYSSGEEVSAGLDIQVVAVNYDGQTFTPSSVNIKVGDYVIFYNKSTKDFWPASGVHPAHLQYPEFDPKKSISAGGKFQFEFMKPGSWTYHDHLNPSAGGVVNVVK